MEKQHKTEQTSSTDEDHEMWLKVWKKVDIKSVLKNYYLKGQE